MEDNKKILVMVMSSDSAMYPLLEKTQRETWNSVNVPNIQTIFYKASNREGFEDDVLHINMPDCSYKLFNKTSRAFRHVMEMEWDYIFKTDNSAYVNKMELLKKVEDFPLEKVYAGKRFYSQKDGPINMINNFIWGEGMFLSRDIVNMFSMIEIINDAPEDIVISNYLRFVIPSIEIDCVVDFEISENMPISHLYRCKKAIIYPGGTNKESDFTSTVDTMQALHKQLNKHYNGKKNRSDQDGRKEIHKASWSSC